MSKRMVAVLCTAAIVVAGLTSSAGAAVVAGNTGWFWSNPLPQGNSLTNIDTIAGRAYAAGAAGALMRSDDGGATWTGIRSGLPAANSAVKTIRAVTPDTVIFAGACGLRRTDDGGATVKRLPWGSNDVDCPATITSLSFPTGNVGYLLLSSGDIMQTTDGGDSWRRQTAAPGSAALGGNAFPTDIWFTNATSGVISIGTQIYYSSDSGSSWTPVKTVGGGGITHFEFISPTEGFAAGDNTDLYTTTDGGATWSAVASDGKTNSAAIGSLSCASVTACLAATSNGAQLLRTTDGGTTWTLITASSAPVYAVGFTSATHAIAVGDAGTLVKTDDAGANWSSLNNAAAGIFSQVHADSPTSAVLFGVGTNVARTTDAGASYKSITTYAQKSIRDATFPTATRGYVLDSSNQLTRSDDAGITWKVLDLQGADPVSLYAPDANTLLLVGKKGVRRSADGGLTFKKTGDAKSRKLKLSKIDAAGSAIVAYGSSAATVSKDRGKKWKTIKLSKKIKGVRLLDFIDAKAGWIVDTKSALWSTTNGGRKWTRIDLFGLGKVESMAHTDKTHGYVSDGSGSIFFTSDKGKTWSQESPFLTTKRTRLIVTPLSTRGAILLVPGSNRILTTTAFGQIGVSSKLTLKASKSKVKKGSSIQVTGKLVPAQGGEQVTVVGATVKKDGSAKWTTQTATVSLGGTFTTVWKVSKPMQFVAYWAGDATHDGDGASKISVKLK